MQNALAVHTPFTDPGPYAALLDAVSVDLDGMSAVARNIVVHYRASAELLDDTRGDINSRWLSTILALDQSRHGRPLTEPRPEERRVQGCCRDHSLFCVGVLRQHGLPARSRVGFARYLVSGYHVDHVVVETWRYGWRLWFDPEMAASASRLPVPTDEEAPEAPFLTAAEAWRQCRAGALDFDSFVTVPGSDVSGEWFVQCYVLLELAHRQGDEMLLWDGWGAMSEPGRPVDAATVTLTDEIAALLVAADRGDVEAERTLAGRYADDERLRPGDEVECISPYGGTLVRVRVRP